VCLCVRMVARQIHSVGGGQDKKCGVFRSRVWVQGEPQTPRVLTYTQQNQPLQVLVAYEQNMFGI